MQQAGALSQAGCVEPPPSEANSERGWGVPPGRSAAAFLAGEMTQSIWTFPERASAFSRREGPGREGPGAQKVQTVWPREGGETPGSSPQDPLERSGGVPHSLLQLLWGGVVVWGEVGGMHWRESGRCLWWAPWQLLAWVGAPQWLSNLFSPCRAWPSTCSQIAAGSSTRPTESAAAGAHQVAPPRSRPHPRPEEGRQGKRSSRLALWRPVGVFLGGGTQNRSHPDP